MRLVSMIGKRLVLPLEDDWQATLDEVARARGFAPSKDVARVAANVAKLSRAYNEGEAMPRGQDVLSARIVFSFPRDVPKGAGAVRELVATGALALTEDRPLSVLDLGAGLGAASWGVARALAAAGQRGTLEVLAVDADAQALEVAAAIARAREGRDPVRVALRSRAHDLARGLPKLDARFDLAIVAQTLSELDRSLDDDARTTKHAEIVRALFETAIAPGGALVVIEPALRDRTRHLHRVRDALAAALPGALFAPCLHEAPCPALARETDWCHEDLAVDLPPWLVPIARAAGLRYQGLTFSYLVLRAGGPSLARALGDDKRKLRVVSERFVTKGKQEAFVCGELASGVGRVRAMRLDRDESEANAAWDECARGDVVAVEPPLDPSKPRVGKDAKVTRLGGT